MRDRRTGADEFRRLCRQVTTLLAIEATRDLATRPVTVETPLEPCEGRELAGELVMVAILRAGMGMVDSIAGLIPGVSIGYLGLERDEDTAEASPYYRKLPPVAGRRVMVVDPMLATGGSAIHALRELKARDVGEMSLLCIISAPEGIARVEQEFPDLPVFTGVLDKKLDERKFIRPGLGDFGDRLYGTDPIDFAT